MRDELQPWMDIRSHEGYMSLNASAERWRGTICEYDVGDDHPNNVIAHAEKVTQHVGRRDRSTRNGDLRSEEVTGRG